ncbi:MAG: hypothetical protein ACOX7F_00950 [Eubacteriales bacterium]|jgi:BirA family biotin operon repressor/biotin-[acetyl-CoA-carboxylase] ligase
MEIYVTDIVESTNASVRDKANMGNPEGHMILANEQTAGRRRSSRSFFFSKDTDVYMSLLCTPKTPLLNKLSELPQWLWYRSSV